MSTPTSFNTSVTNAVPEQQSIQTTGLDSSTSRSVVQQDSTLNLEDKFKNSATHLSNQQSLGKPREVGANNKAAVLSGSMYSNPLSATQIKSEATPVSMPTMPEKEVEIPFAAQSILTTVGTQSTSRADSVKTDVMITQEKSTQIQNKGNESFGQKFVRGLKKVGKGFVTTGKVLASVPLFLCKALCQTSFAFDLVSGIGKTFFFEIAKSKPHTIGGGAIKLLTSPLWGVGACLCGAMEVLGKGLSKGYELLDKAWDALWDKK